MDTVKNSMGWIEVVCGPMFSGKSEELIRRLKRAEIARQRVQIFKPVIDNRYSETEIVSHSELRIQAETIERAEEILDKLDPRTEVVGIDEAHFLNPEVVEVAERLANMGKRVIVAGLETDYLGKPFEQVMLLLTAAEEVTKLLAICVRCGNPAKHTQRLTASQERILVGAGGVYEARCRRCFEPVVAETEEAAQKTKA
ncbi:MAG: thymidine kinase [Terriglobia bacterium]